MIETADVRPGQVLRITRMGHGENTLADELGLGDGHIAYGIVLDAENMMVFTQIEQHGYPGAKGGKMWASRVYPTGWCDVQTTEAVEADAVQEDVPPEFWPISARAGLNGGI